MRGCIKATRDWIDFNPLAVEVLTYDHKVYYPGATELVVRLMEAQILARFSVPSYWVLSGRKSRNVLIPSPRRCITECASTT